MYKTIHRAPKMWASPILSGLRSLNETVEVPRPPDLVVTMISPLSSLAGPTRQTILLADIHSAVSRQLWPQIERPEEEEKRKVTGVSDIDTGRQQKQTECSNETQTHTIHLCHSKLVPISWLSQTVDRGSEFKSGLSRGWVAMTFHPFTQLLSSHEC